MLSSVCVARTNKGISNGCSVVVHCSCKNKEEGLVFLDVLEQDKTYMGSIMCSVNFKNTT